ncbi:hypothetical protein [uncultured Lacinutrix sp.]|uniref:hypothetical protein n=1 Tax=uncultured Lacinutrix sp. TaxID=574032 RepID=UPI002635E388|nr:hypothetical protein [uncultured Lacinutrix sp.]
MENSFYTLGILSILIIVFKFIMMLFAITAGYYVLKLLMLYQTYLKLKIQDLNRKMGQE